MTSDDPDVQRSLDAVVAMLRRQLATASTPSELARMVGDLLFTVGAKRVNAVLVAGICGVALENCKRLAEAK